MFAKTFYFFKIFLLSIYLSHISELFAFTQSNKNENFFEKSYKRPNYEYSKIGFPFSLKVKNIRNDHCVEAAEHDDYLTFDQQLDHFDSTNNATWKQRYLANMAFFDFSLPSYSPMFLMFGEKREIRSLFVSAGQMFNNAEQFNAGMVILEHRYFGESHPTANTSIENLKYFTIEQSLEDAVTFIKFIKRKYNISDNHKWIIFGGDYAGNLAAWLRLKHPDLVLGAVASSAPLQAKLSFDTFLQEMDTDLGKGCVNEVRLAMNEFTHKLGSDSGREYLTNLFGLCTPLKNANQLDISLLVYIISIPFQGAAMFNEENPRFPNDPGVCEIMTDRRYGASALERLRVTLWEYRISNCVYFQYKPYVDLVAEVGWLNYTSDYRMRLYLQCSSIGQFVTTSHNVDQPFGDYFSVEFFVQQCKDIFGPQFDQQAIERAVERTNKVYGGTNLSTTPTLSNVVYVNGQRDPWRVLGVLEQPPNRPTLLPVVISGSAHNEDIDVPDVHDSPELTEARAKINKAIERMLAEQQQQQQQQH